MVHSCRGFSHGVQLHPWEAYYVNLGEFADGWFIYVGDNKSSLKINRCNIAEVELKLLKIGSFNAIDAMA